MTERRPGFISRVLLWMLDFYQKGISPLTPPSCRFEPTCSNYAVEAVRVHGAWYGTWLAVWRVLRCGPWTPGGWDPVPEARAPDPDPGSAPPEHPTPSERS
jgi:putative membrane protein insertion efficiency factor